MDNLFVLSKESKLPHPVKISVQQLLQIIVIICVASGFSDNANAASCNVDVQLADGSELTRSFSMDETLKVRLPTGENTLLFQCDTSQQGVLIVGPVAILKHSFQIDGINVERLQSNKISFITPPRKFNGIMKIDKEIGFAVRMTWQPIEKFIIDNQKNYFVVSIFYGLCITLALYILLLGFHLKQQRFYYYSLYVFSIMFFLLLQEGQLNLFFPLDWGQNSLIILMFVAGLTIFLGTIFLVKLLGLDKLWPKLTVAVLLIPADIVMLLSFALLMVNETWFNRISPIISWMAIFIIFANIVLISRAAMNKVHTANYVLLAVCVLLIAMVLRVAIPDMDVSVRKYSLFFSVAIESFLLAIATSEKIKRINVEGKLAKREARTDDLCEIYNRRGWLLEAQKLLDQQKEKGGFLIVFYIDLNKFKKINDAHGHHVGDEVLQEVSRLIKHQVKSSDPVGRIGGDEFVVISYFENKKHSEEMLERLKKHIKTTLIKCSVGEIEVTASIGIQKYSEPPSGIDQILRETDEDMYQQKLTFQQS